MITQIFPSESARKRFKVGPLAPHIEEIATFLLKQGYAMATLEEKLNLTAKLSQWLCRRKVSLIDLDEKQIKKFFTYYQRRYCTRGAMCTCLFLLKYLRSVNRIPQPELDLDISPQMCLLSEYEQFLVTERGVSQATLTNYLPTVRRFLITTFGPNKLRIKKLCPKDIHKFVLKCAQTFSRSRVQLMVTTLRSFCRFLLQRGYINVDFADAIPSIANWRMNEFPRYLDQETVESLLASCDQCTAVGQRDYAILLLLARLGLRAGEVVALTLDDIDWETGVFTVNGKGKRLAELPLPREVGKALVNYLCKSRPRCSARQVFIRIRAPHKGFSTSAAIDDVVRRSLVRVGLDLDFKGAHLLRHSLATTMLGGGASLEEVGEVLRHCRPETTQIYAKVNMRALREIAQPWPGGVI
jgi:site-specific recombinase XerD